MTYSALISCINQIQFLYYSHHLLGWYAFNIIITTRAEGLVGRHQLRKKKKAKFPIPNAIHANPFHFRDFLDVN